MGAALPVLHQFRGSHFNEKVRWALDWKGIPHRRVTHLPGPHALAMRRRTPGTQVPVLELGDQTVWGSARILAALDEHFPDRQLHPEDPVEREEALAIQREFDEEVGPAVRLAHFSVLLGERAYTADLFSAHRGALGRGLYRLAFPGVRQVIVQSIGLGAPDAAERAIARAEAGLDFVARRVGTSGRLVGDRFGLADLACAALLAPLVNPDHPDMRAPEPLPAPARAFLERFAGHEAAAWVREQYAKHRPPPRQVP